MSEIDDDGRSKKAPTRRSAPMKHRRATLAEVAARAGVSRSAASFVMTGRTDQRISEDTWTRVQDAAEALGYRPNQAALAFRTGTSGTVALISDYVSTTSMANAMIRGALEELRSHGSLLFIGETLGDKTQESTLIEKLIDRQVDGYLYATMFTRAVTIPEPLRSVPLVLLNCVSADDFQPPTVVPDEFDAGRRAAGALLEAGHREGIFFLGASPAGVTGGAQWQGWEPLALGERLRGVNAALEDAGATLEGVVELRADWSATDGREAVARLLATGARPKAIVCVNDAVAFGAYQALMGEALAIPDDVSIISFDDSDASRWLEPQLTSFALPHEQMGHRAAELLLAKDATPSVSSIALPLRVRKSVAPPR